MLVELLGEQRHFVGSEFEARQRGDALDVGASEDFGHAHRFYPPRRRCGQWYPGTRGALERDVDRYLDAVGPGISRGAGSTPSSRPTPA